MAADRPRCLGDAGSGEQEGAHREQGRDKEDGTPGHQVDQGGAHHWPCRWQGGHDGHEQADRVAPP